MSECKHEWQGNADGVTCTKCGTSLTHEEYLELLNPTEKPKGGKRGSKSKAAETAESVEPKEVDNDE